MTIFSKIDKEVLIALVATVILILLLGFIAYQYFFGPAVKVQNLTGGVQTELKVQ